MEQRIIAIFCLIDEFLKEIGLKMIKEHIFQAVKCY